MMTKNQFSVLTTMEACSEPLTQREIAYKTGLSLGSVNRIYSQLSDEGFVADGAISEQGLQALEPFRVKRAVFIAAGFGSRLVPVTINTPKPLVRVHGQRLIDHSIDACIKAGIEEIYIVRGYLAEQFDQLLYKYPNIKFIENEKYNESNNISSAVLAKDYMKNAYVFEADLLLYNPDIITKYQYESNYIGVPVEKTDDWCFHTKPNGVITKIGIGGTDCYHMFGISYWTYEDGEKLAKHLPLSMQRPGGKEMFWDLCPLGDFKKEYKVHIRPCNFDDVIEIDTFSELKRLDPSYA